MIIENKYNITDKVQTLEWQVYYVEWISVFKDFIIYKLYDWNDKVTELYERQLQPIVHKETALWFNK